MLASKSLALRSIKSIEMMAVGIERDGCLFS